MIALVFAMFGGAYAASKSSGGGKATASKTKVVKGPRGPKGATGPAGPQGPAGPAGAKGDTGAAGSNGASGQAGAPGTNGKSVVTTPIDTGETGCNGLGGTEVEVEGSGQVEEVCNGEEGAAGVGSPWTAGGTLPAGSTETGAWAVGTISNLPANTQVYTPLSFSIPTKGRIENSKIIYVPTPATNPDPVHCPGTAAAPSAASGYLCIYRTSINGFNDDVSAGGTAPVFNNPNPGVNVPDAGVIMGFSSPTALPEPSVFGRFAVTGQ